MKRILAILMAGLMLLSLAACGGKNENVLKFCMLEVGMQDGLKSDAHVEHVMKLDEQNDIAIEYVNYNNLSSALMDLESGKANCHFDYDPGYLVLPGSLSVRKQRNRIRKARWCAHGPRSTGKNCPQKSGACSRSQLHLLRKPHFRSDGSSARRY